MKEVDASNTAGKFNEEWDWKVVFGLGPSVSFERAISLEPRLQKARECT